MRVVYYTNKDISDWEVIPGIIKSTGDEVITMTDRVTLDFVRENDIDFIVSDRSRFLIREDLIEFLDKKIVNLHPSFLPWNRGYNPNYWSIKENTAFGVSLHFIDKDIDTGAILAQARTFYSGNDTLRSTYFRLRMLMVKLFEACWPDVRACTIPGEIQDRNAGNIHYKNDFNGVYENLPRGWDTKINDIP